MQNSADQVRPLAGVRVMVTRPIIAGGSAADPLAQRLQLLGAEVIAQPAICIGPPGDWRPVDDALARLQEYDWLVFSSANGVRALMERWRHFHRQDEAPADFPHLAAIGPGTADELTRHGLPVDLMPTEFRAEALADALATKVPGTFVTKHSEPKEGGQQRFQEPFLPEHPEIEKNGTEKQRCQGKQRFQEPLLLADRRFLLARASRGRDVLARRLRDAGAHVEEIVVYASTDIERPSAETAEMLHAGRIDWVTATSSAIARSLVRMFGDELRRAKLASISPITSDVLRELGYAPEAEAVEYTLAGLATAIGQRHDIASSEGCEE